MRCSLHRTMPLVLLIATLLLTACQVPLPYLPTFAIDVATMDEVGVDDAMAAEPGGDESDGASDDEAAGEETAEPGSADTEADTETDKRDGVDVAAIEEPDAPSRTMATILTRSLRIRSGPGADYDIVGGAAQGESFAILGETNDCEWLNVEHPTLGAVWLSGSPDYTSMDADCTQVAAPSTASSEIAAPAAESEADAADPAPAQESQQESIEAEADTLPADQGCYLVQNYVGPELNITITAQDREWSDNFQIGEGSEVPYCLLPGQYTVKVDAPPPWGDLNDELTVQAGDRYYWPIRSGE